MDKFPLTMIVLVKFEKIVVEKSEKKIRINKLFLYIFCRRIKNEKTMFLNTFFFLSLLFFKN